MEIIAEMKTPVRSLVYILAINTISIVEASSFRSGFVAADPLRFLNLDSIPESDILLGVPNVPTALWQNFDRRRTSSCNIGVFQLNATLEVVGSRSQDDLIVVLRPGNDPISLDQSFQVMDQTLAEMPAWRKRRSYFFLVWPALIGSETEIRTASLEATSSAAFTADTNVFVLFETSKGSEFTLYETYSVKDVRVWSRIVARTQVIDLNQLNLRSAGVRRTSFQGVTFPAVATYTGDEHLYAADAEFDNSSGVLSFESGISVSLYRDLGFMLNFTEMAVGGGWMYANKNGTLVGESAEPLLTGQVDISISQEGMREEIVELVTFLHPTYPLSIFAFAKQPDFSLRSNIYVEPFGSRLWKCVLLSAFLISVCFEVMCRFGSCSSSSSPSPEELQGESILFTAGWLCQQGWHVYPSASTLRILFLTSYLTGAIFYGAYTAALVSKLSVRVSQLNSLQDLIAHQYKFVVNRNSVSMTAYGKTFGSFYSQGIHVVAKKESEILEGLLKSKQALLYYWDSVDAIFSYNRSDPSTSTFICESIVSLLVKEKPSGMVLPKGSPFREILNHRILKIKEMGLNHRYINEYERVTRPLCPTKTAESQVRQKSLRLVDIYSSFVMLLMGASAALASFLAELITKNNGPVGQD